MARREQVSSRRLRRVTMLLSLAMLGFGVYWAAGYWLDAPVQRVTVEGELQFVQRSEIEQKLVAAIDDTFLKLDLKKLKAELEAHPWIYFADVQRKWPYSLHVAITEEKPIARWEREGFVNQDGRVVKVDLQPQGGALTELSGESQYSRDMLKLYKKLAEQASQEHLEIVSLSQDSVGAISLHFNDGSQLLLGREELQTRMQRFLKVYQIEKTPGLIFDARYSSGIAVSKVLAQQSEPHLAMQ